MVNNRLLLICKVCNKSIIIAKHTGGPWYPVTDEEYLSIGFGRHEDCFYGKYPPMHNNIFTLEYENGEDD